LLAHLVHSFLQFSSFRKQKGSLLAHFASLLAHFSTSRTHFGIFRKQIDELLSQTAVCLLISVHRAFMTAIALLRSVK